MTMKHGTVFVSGNFNVLHPGHLRLLRFAKENGSRLVVGVFTDRAAGAAAHVPQEFRLEAVKMNGLVDEAFFVDEPVEDVILRLKPALVVKGKEHKTRENPERKAVESYGGKLLFSSGDVVFTSLDLIRREMASPEQRSIALPKQFMERRKVSAKSLKELLAKFKGLKVVVVGDVIADSMHDVVRAPQHFFPEGWDTFLKSIYSPFQERIQTGQRVLKINRCANHVQVVLNGHAEDFDQVIMAVPPSLALNLLADASAAEAALLRKFATISTTVFMHSDSSWLPAGMPWATINLMQDERGSFCTFWNGELHPGKPPVFITWGDGLTAVPDPAQTRTTVHWLRTLPTVSYSKASREMEAIQGNGGVWHCGAHVHALDADSIPSLWHENAFRSGVRIAELISAQPGATI